MLQYWRRLETKHGARAFSTSPEHQIAPSRFPGRRKRSRTDHVQTKLRLLLDCQRPSAPGNWPSRGAAMPNADLRNYDRVASGAPNPRKERAEQRKVLRQAKQLFLSASRY